MLIFYQVMCRLMITHRYAGGHPAWNKDHTCTHAIKLQAGSGMRMRSIVNTDVLNDGQYQ